MGADVEDFDLGGGGSEGIGALFQGSSIGSVAVRGRDVGPHPPYGAGSDQISAQVCATTLREASKEAGVCEL